MALAIDATSSGVVGSGTSITVSHTCTGSNRLLFVCVALVRAADTDVITATYNSVSMTQVADHDHSLAAVLSNRIFRLIAPATGANDIVVSTDGTAMAVHAAGISFTDGHQTTPEGTASGADGVASPATVSVTSATGEIVIDSVEWNGNSALTVGAGQTAFQNESDGASGTPRQGGASSEAGAASVTMSWTSSNTVWGIVGIPVKPVSTVTTNVTLTAAVTVAATFTRSFIRGVSLSAAISVATALTRIMTFARNLAAGVVVTPALTRIASFVRLLSAAVLVTPTLVLAATFQRVLSAAVTVIATLSVTTTFARTLAAPAVVNATVTVLRVIVVALSASVTVTATLVTLFIAGAGRALNRLVGLIRGIGIAGRP